MGNEFAEKMIDSMVDENGCGHGHYANPGDRIVLKATVKEHSEYKGVKQTVIQRPAVKSIESA